MKSKFKQPLYIAAAQEAKPTPYDAIPKKYHYVKRSDNGRVSYWSANNNWVTDLSLAKKFETEAGAQATANALSTYYKEICVFSTTK